MSAKAVGGGDGSDQVLSSVSDCGQLEIWCVSSRGGCYRGAGHLP